MFAITEKATEGSLFSNADSGLITYAAVFNFFGRCKIDHDHALTSLEYGVEASYMYSEHVGFVSTVFFITSSEFSFVQVAPTVRAWVYDSVAITLAVDYRYLHSVIFTFSGLTEIHQVSHKVLLVPGITVRPVQTENASIEIAGSWLIDFDGTVDLFRLRIRCDVEFLVISVDVTGIPRDPVVRNDLDVIHQTTKTMQVVTSLGIRIYW